VVIASHSDRHPPPDGLAITGIVLVVVAIASALTARSLAKPLARLSAAARAFGEGQRGVRVGITRHDEIGEVAAAFDDMASRVEGLLKAERELLANVSHELRTPLARIRVALELAASGDAATVSDSVGEITRDLAELDRLIGDVLVAARLDLAADPASAAIPPLRRQQVDLDDVIGQAVSRFRSAHPERALVLSVAPVLPTLSGDPVLLRRAIDNLLDNAHKYGDGGVVELSAETIEGGARVEIRDHGIGIAEGDMAHVFRPFFRADRSRTRSTGGLGLGLALSRRIVEAHDGTLTLQSKLGEGTCARIELRVRP
jgi:signal transduction histidine kinase